MTSATTNPTNDLFPDDVYLAIGLHGQGVELGSISVGTVCRYSDSLRLALQAAVEVVESIKTTKPVGRRKRWVERMADLPLIGVRPGGVQILLGQPRQDGLFAVDERESFDQAVELLFRRLHGIAEESSGDDPGDESQPEGSRSVAELRFRASLIRLAPPRTGPLTEISLHRRVVQDGATRLDIVTLNRRCRKGLESAPEAPTPADGDSFPLSID